SQLIDPPRQAQLRGRRGWRSPDRCRHPRLPRELERCGLEDRDWSPLAFRPLLESLSDLVPSELAGEHAFRLERGDLFGRERAVRGCLAKPAGAMRLMRKTHRLQ